MDKLPRWARDLHQSLSVNPQFVVWGNIRDTFLIDGDPPAFVDLLQVVWQVLEASGYECLLVHDPVDGLRILPFDAEDRSQPSEQARAAVDAILPSEITRAGGPLDFAQMRQLLEGVVRQRDHRVAVAIDYASRLVADAEDLTDDERRFFTHAQKLSHTAIPMVTRDVRPSPLYNAVLWFTDDERDLPSWFAGQDSPVRILPVPEPHLGQRVAVATRLVRQLGAHEEQEEHLAKAFADATHGLSIANHVEIHRLARDIGLPAERIEDAVRAFKVGVLEDPWTRPDLRQRVSAEEVRIRRKLLGQHVAITRTFDILKRTVMGMSGAQAGRTGRPRGVLFFAGPTGVGKTELAKQVAAAVFGDTDAYLRFDMSEFAQEHAEARLIGAPPGYIGHASGGELTRAVREQPFRLVLFDEIEKAHDRILDKFLQLLDDGRLTDGQGDTVHFTETIIVFTSNLGVVAREGDGPRRRLVDLSHPYERIESQIRTAVEDFFTYELGRPEMVSRIGDNIVVFDFIREDVAPRIFDAFLANVTERVEELHGICIELSSVAHDTLQRHCTAELEKGARGIAAALEGALVNPLARLLFDDDKQSRTVLRIEEVRRSSLGVELVAE